MVIRKCHDLEEMSACVALQKEVWNFTDAELVPLRMFIVAEKIGGQVIGAFDDGKLVAFALSMPGARGGHSYLHSQMLAVRAEYRNAGLGRRIKLFQREDALARGFELIEWTFDPLEIKNAYLNIERLGAIARRYSVNQYGLTSSPLAGRVALRPAGCGMVVEVETGRVVRAAALGSALAVRRANSRSVERQLQVPAEIYRVESFAGYAASGAGSSGSKPPRFSGGIFPGLGGAAVRTGSAGNGKFLLGRWDENWMYSF